MSHPSTPGPESPTPPPAGRPADTEPGHAGVAGPRGGEYGAGGPQAEQFGTGSSQGGPGGAGGQYGSGAPQGGQFEAVSSRGGQYGAASGDAGPGAGGWHLGPETGPRDLGPGETFGAPFVPRPAPEPKPPWNRAIAVTGVVFLIAGIVAGWAWQQFAPLAQYTVDENGAALGEEQMTRVFGPDGTFVAIGFLTALVLGAALFWWIRDHGPGAVAVVTIGATAAAGIAWGVGMLLGNDPLQPRLATARPGDLLAAPLELHTWTPLAAWLVGAALAAALVSALTWRAEPPADTRRPPVPRLH